MKFRVVQICINNMNKHTIMISPAKIFLYSIAVLYAMYFILPNFIYFMGIFINILAVVFAIDSINSKFKINKKSDFIEESIEAVRHISYLLMKKDYSGLRTYMIMMRCGVQAYIYNKLNDDAIMNKSIGEIIVLINSYCLLEMFIIIYTGNNHPSMIILASIYLSKIGNKKD